MAMMGPEELDAFAARMAARSTRPVKKRGRVSGWWDRLWTYRRLSRP